MRDITDEERPYVQKKLFELLLAFKNICDAEGIWYSLAFGSVLGAVRHKGFIPWDTDADVFIMLPDKEKFREAFYKHKPSGICLINCSTQPKCLKSHDCLTFEKEELIGDIHLDIFQLVGAPSTLKAQKMFIKYAHYTDKIVRSKYVDINQVRPENKIKVRIAKAFLSIVPDKLLKRNIQYREYKYPYDTCDYLMALSGYGKRRECVPKWVFNDTIPMQFEDERFMIPKDYNAYLTRIYGKDYMTPKRY